MAENTSVDKNELPIDADVDAPVCHVDNHDMTGKELSPTIDDNEWDDFEAATGNADAESRESMENKASIMRESSDITNKLSVSDDVGNQNVLSGKKESLAIDDDEWDDFEATTSDIEATSRDAVQDEASIMRESADGTNKLAVFDETVEADSAYHSNLSNGDDDPISLVEDAPMTGSDEWDDFEAATGNEEVAARKSTSDRANTLSIFDKMAGANAAGKSVFPSSADEPIFYADNHDNLSLKVDLLIAEDDEWDDFEAVAASKVSKPTENLNERENQGDLNKLFISDGMGDSNAAYNLAMSSNAVDALAHVTKSNDALSVEEDLPITEDDEWDNFEVATVFAPNAAESSLDVPTSLSCKHDTRVVEELSLKNVDDSNFNDVPGLVESTTKESESFYSPNELPLLDEATGKQANGNNNISSLDASHTSLPDGERKSEIGDWVKFKTADIFPVKEGLDQTLQSFTVSQETRNGEGGCVNNSNFALGQPNESNFEEKKENSLLDDNFLSKDIEKIQDGARIILGESTVCFGDNDLKALDTSTAVSGVVRENIVAGNNIASSIDVISGSQVGGPENIENNQGIKLLGTSIEQPVASSYSSSNMRELKTQEEACWDDSDTVDENWGDFEEVECHDTDSALDGGIDLVGIRDELIRMQLKLPTDLFAQDATSIRIDNILSLFTQGEVKQLITDSLSLSPSYSCGINLSCIHFIILLITGPKSCYTGTFEAIIARV